MISMDQIQHIRDLYYHQGMNISEIASATNLNRKTVQKYVDKDDFNIPKPIPDSENSHESKLDPFKPLIDSWLIADKKASRKQRHTAKRVFNRLTDEVPDFRASYRLVASYVAGKKKELQLKRSDNGHLPLIHHPGEAQADFGYADFYENGKLHKEGKYLVLSFPYSNGAYLQLNYGENMECLFEGLEAMFEHIGGVPTEIWFDNTATIVTEIIKGGKRTLTERFRHFCAHYRFEPKFMNPDSGWEKGNVENKVGYLRRNELVPIPAFNRLPDKNRELLSACDKDMQREHYDNPDSKYISELFETDKQALLPLPAVPFDPALYMTVQTNPYGKFTLDNGKHRYSSSPDHCGTTIQLRITSSHVTVMDQNLQEIVTHHRLYGAEYESMDWIPYLSYIAKRPRSLRNSGIYDMMPETLRFYMDSCENSERGKILKVLAELTERDGFEAALNTVDVAVQYRANDAESLESLYRRVYADVPLLPPLPESPEIPQQKIIPFPSDMAQLDACLRGGVSRG